MPNAGSRQGARTLLELQAYAAQIDANMQADPAQLAEYGEIIRNTHYVLNRARALQESRRPRSISLLFEEV